MLTLEAVTPQVLPPELILLLPLLDFLLLQGEDLFRWCLLEGFGNVVVFVEVLFLTRLPPTVGAKRNLAKCHREENRSLESGVGKEEKIGGMSRTISPKSSTFSPRTRKTPRLMSAYRFWTKMRSMVSWRTRFAASVEKK